MAGLFRLGICRHTRRADCRARLTTIPEGWSSAPLTLSRPSQDRPLPRAAPAPVTYGWA
jgi:hypothetical protein